MEEIDEAFNWLMLILTTLASALVQFPQLYPAPFRPSDPEIPFMKLLITPLILLVIFWLSSHFVQNKETKIALKCFSWTYALLILAEDLNFLLNAFLAENITYEYGLLFVVLTIFAPNLIYLGAIRKQYKRIFPDSTFLKSNKKQILLCAMITVFAVVTPSFLGR